MQILERCPPTPPGAAPARIGTELVLRVLFGVEVEENCGEERLQSEVQREQRIASSLFGRQAFCPFALLPLFLLLGNARGLSGQCALPARTWPAAT